MLTIDKLVMANPWWTTAHVPKEVIPDYKRALFFEIQKYRQLRQILAIIGLRRTGKTTILYQLVDQLLQENVKPKSILYFSFDEGVEDLHELFIVYQEQMLKGDLSNEKVYVFLDEIQKLKDWQNKIKIYYDRYPNIKFFISGSASINILLDSKESLAGRVFYFVLEVLSFEEFLALRGKNLEKIRENLQIWKLEIKKELNHYLLRPFPEIIHAEDSIAKMYIKESVIEKAIFRDLNSLFVVKDIELIEKLVHILAANPGMLVNLDDLSKDLGRSRQVLSNYLYYLEICFVVKSLRNFKGSFKVSSRKLKKYYVAHPCISMAAASPEKGKVIENLIQFVTKAGYFWRERQREVDFILLNEKKIIPVESKYSREVRVKELKSLIGFMEEFEVGEGKVITEDSETKFNANGKTIVCVPLWKWLLEVH